MVFVHHRETLNHLDALLSEQGISFAPVEGLPSGPNKGAVIAAFQERIPVLLSTESGGEGRNLLFCNTLINFDLPWNPIVIEQRIGRIHRIGQTRIRWASRNYSAEYGPTIYSILSELHCLVQYFSLFHDQLQLGFASIPVSLNLLHIRNEFFQAAKAMCKCY